MDRLRRRRGDEVPDEWRVPAPQHDPPQGSDAESLLDLQARAGNRAVTELVGAPGTDAGRTSVQRDGADGTPTATPDKGTSPRVDTLSIPDLKLGVPIQSFQGTRRGPGREGGRGGDRGGEPESTAGEVTVTLLAEHLSSKLFEAAAKGRQFGTVTITLGAATITLHGVVISGVQMSTNSASLTLNFSSMEFDTGTRPEPPTSEWSE